jgi:hypothetical protein
MEIGEKPAWAEKEGVRFAYCERETPNLSQLSRTQAIFENEKPGCSTHERREQPCLSLLTCLRANHRCCLEMTEPVTRERTEALLDVFMSCRRMLLNPTNEELLELVSDADPKIRDAARLTMVKFGKR